MSRDASTGSAGPARMASAGLPPALLVLFYVALALLPLALATVQRPSGPSFWRELSSGLVMVGYAILLVQFLLSGRFHRISGNVGIDLTMRFHQLAGLTILGFILVHPFLYAVPRLENGLEPAMRMLNGMFTSQGLRNGVIAWWLLILLIPLAVWRDRMPFAYEIWRLSHGLGAAAIAILATHHTLRVGTYAADPWLSGFWLVLTALALGSLVHVYLVKPILQRQSSYRVTGNRKVAERMWEVAVEPEDGKAIDFAPGQFVWLNLGHSPFSVTEHPFSISSAPHERPRIAFTIKQSGDFTDRIGEIAEGTTAYLDGPYGNFTIAGRAASGFVFIAGGVGFAPIVGMLRHLAAKRDGRPATLIYGNRSVAQILYRDELTRIQSALNLDIHLVLSEPPANWDGVTGELTPDVLERCLAGGHPERLHFVCGPTPMMDSVEHSLMEMGVPGSRILSERFKYD